MRERNDDGIKDEQYCADQGRIIGRRLMQELKFKEGAKHRLEEGELDVGDMIENMQENEGVLKSFEVFSDNTPLIHDHTVCIMIDMSGSMRGDDIQIARAAALMLGKALEEMNIIYSIRGFGAVEGVLEIHDIVVKDFEEPLDMVKLRRMFMGNVNRDTDSIRHVIKMMSGERGKKMIFVISDGHPNHYDGTNDYRDYNANSFMDMWFLTREAEKEGVSVIGIGVSAEANAFISKTYLKGFYIDDIKELPERLVKIYLAESASLRPVWRKI
jgi:nitric oxide reductase activation protein